MKVARRAPGAGVRKPQKDETAEDVAVWCVRRYGDFDAGGLLPTCVGRLFGIRPMRRGARSAGRLCFVSRLVVLVAAQNVNQKCRHRAPTVC